MESKQILIVDDSPEVNQMMCWMLEDAGYEVHSAESAEDGLQKAEEIENLPLLLMDIVLPKMSGQEAIEILRKNPKFNSTVIIAVTAETDPDELSHILHLGANDILTKPVNEESLIKTVRHYL